MTQVLGVAPDVAKKVIDEAVVTMDTLKEHRYHVHWQIYGRKPESE